MFYGSFLVVFWYLSLQWSENANQLWNKNDKNLIKNSPLLEKMIKIFWFKIDFYIYIGKQNLPQMLGIKMYISAALYIISVCLATEEPRRRSQNPLRNSGSNLKRSHETSSADEEISGLTTLTDEDSQGFLRSIRLGDGNTIKSDSSSGLIKVTGM